MNRLGGMLVAVSLFVATLLLRHSANDTVKGISITAILAMWCLVLWSVRLKWGQAGMDQWQGIRQRGKMYFAFIYGGPWLLFLLLFSPSLSFAAGEPIKFEQWWLSALVVCAWPAATLWEWRSRERKFSEKPTQEVR